MHPNTFLMSLWRTKVLDQVFVAMSFEPRFAARFEEVIRPAIEDEPFAGNQLSAYRVDNSKTGDSILTDIVNGIAHSRLVLADVSVVDEGRFTQVPMRNGNVMYEVGVALACRSPSEVLLVRDDSKGFLFDVSTIPHLQVDFAETDAAVASLRNAIADRLREADLVEDARIRIAAESLTQDEMRILSILAGLGPNQARDLSLPALEGLSNPDARGVDGLLRKGCAKSVAVKAETGAMFYALTPFGYALERAASELLATVKSERPLQDENGGPEAS